MSKANLCIVQDDYESASKYLDSARALINLNTRYHLSEIISKKALCELLNNNISDAKTTLDELNKLTEEYYTQIGVAVANCVKAKLSIISKTELNREIKISAFNTFELFELSLYCKKIEFSTKKTKVITEKILSTFAYNGISKWNTELT